MHLYKHLYASDSLKKKRRQIAWKLKTYKFMPDIYVVTLAENRDLLEIYHSAILKQPYFKQYSPYVVGIAQNRDEAIELAQRIIIDTIHSNGNLDVKAYICREGK